MNHPLAKPATRSSAPDSSKRCVGVESQEVVMDLREFGDGRFKFKRVVRAMPVVAVESLKAYCAKGRGHCH